MSPWPTQTAETGCLVMRTETASAPASVALPAPDAARFHLAAKALPRAADWMLIRVSSPINLHARTISFWLLERFFFPQKGMADSTSNSQIIAPVLILHIRHEPSLEAVATRWPLSEKEQSVMGAACAGEKAFFNVQLNLSRASNTAHMRSFPSSPPTAKRSPSAPSTAQQLIEGSVIFRSETYIWDAIEIAFEPLKPGLRPRSLHKQNPLLKMLTSMLLLRPTHTYEQSSLPVSKMQSTLRLDSSTSAAVIVFFTPDLDEPPPPAQTTR
mmetsp:Transcript_30214/g.90497  ORF Transcript_30214/g.90497 Transcript_30214/m.90497 type:complete len:270 (+) Transcript_30214:842-1651(+)